MVKIEKMTSLHLGDVITFNVEGEQLQYVDTIDNILTCVNAQVRPHVIVSDNEVVGFFLIDTVYGKHYDFAEVNSLGLRSFFIDHRYQGKGYAKQTLQMLPTYLTSNYPKHTGLYLTVNCRNTLAKDCYLKNGFYDTESLYHGGESGPQYVMRLDLNVL